MVELPSYSLYRYPKHCFYIRYHDWVDWVDVVINVGNMLNLIALGACRIFRWAQTPIVTTSFKRRSAID